jgi:NAD(P) transhydrogenase subunit alpha
MKKLAYSIVLSASLALPAFAADSSSVSPTVFLAAIFAMACFVGYYVVWSVTPALHTPLMAVTNAISSVIVVGAIVATMASGNAPGGWIAKAMGGVAVALASVNIFGGFLVTQRMLAMYKKKDS